MGLPYEFVDSASDKPGLFRKTLYIGNDLYGIGEGTTKRKAKIDCAREALKNLEEGRTV